LRLTSLIARLPDDALKLCAGGDCRESTNGVSNHLERRILTGYLGYANMSPYANVSQNCGSVMRFVAGTRAATLRGTLKSRIADVYRATLHKHVNRVTVNARHFTGVTAMYISILGSRFSAERSFRAVSTFESAIPER
jgi:hypothetical protein